MAVVSAAYGRKNRTIHEKQDHPHEKQDHPRGAPGWYTFAINSLKSASYQLRSGQTRTRTAFSCKIQTSAWHPRSGDRGQERGIISDDHRTDFLQAIQDSLRSQRKAFFPATTANSPPTANLRPCAEVVQRQDGKCTTPFVDASDSLFQITAAC